MTIYIACALIGLAAIIACCYIIYKQEEPPIYVTTLTTKDKAIATIHFSNGLSIDTEKPTEEEALRAALYVDELYIELIKVGTSKIGDVKSTLYIL